MSGLENERTAVERLGEGVETLKSIRTWSTTVDEMNRSPLRLLENTRMIDQARARGEQPSIDALLEERQALEERVVELQAKVMQLESERGLDGLTGVANRKRLDETLQREWRRCGRAREPVAMVFIDLDDFKAVNDTHGHRAGDALLVGIGQQLNRVMRRAGDMVGRFGGDEFVVLLPATEVEEAAGVAQKVQETLSKMEVQYGKIILRGSASIGVATVFPHKAGSSIELLYDRADKAVYAAKNLGRNRIIATVEQPDGTVGLANVSLKEEEAVEAERAQAPARAARR